jgi:hypothetical protein
MLVYIHIHFNNFIMYVYGKLRSAIHVYDYE